MKIGELKLGYRPCVAASFYEKIESSCLQYWIQSGLDIAEFRVDLCSSQDLPFLIDSVRSFLFLPTIATIRSVSEGGQGVFSLDQCIQLYDQLIPEVDSVDLELQSDVLLRRMVPVAIQHHKPVIVSSHFLTHTPMLSVLINTVKQSIDQGASIVKVAAMVHSFSDIQRLAQLLLMFKHPMIVIGMGELGGMTRVMFPVLGSVLTFGHVGNITAPGQLEVTQLVKLWKSVLGDDFLQKK